MKKPIDYVKHFALSDALFRGTALSSNLILLSIIATTPAFGAKGILGNAFLQLSISGLLEIPTGRFADKFGWYQSIKIGLRLKFITTFLFALAVMSVHAGMTTLSWGFIGGEAVVDAFAGAFINGAYAAAYGKWYEENLKSVVIGGSSIPPLFVSAFKYAIPVRFGLPIFSLLIGSLGFYFGHLNANVVFLMLIGFVFFLRFVVYSRVIGDLKFVSNSVIHKSKRDRFSVKDIIALQSTPLVLYGISVLLTLGTSFYLYGEIYKYLRVDSPDIQRLWIKGTVVGLAINLISVLTSRSLSSKVAKLGAQQVFQIAPVVLLVLSSMTLLCKFLVDRAFPNAVILFLFCIFSATFGQLIQSWISSNIIKQLPEAVRATWSSVGQVFGLFSFGVIAFFGLIFKYAFPSEIIFFIGVMVLTLFSYGLIISDKNPVYLLATSLKSYLTRAIIGTTTLCLVFLIGIDLLTYRRSSTLIKENSNTIVLNALTAALKEPARQGSYTEILTRLGSIQKQVPDICVVVTINAAALGRCETFSKGAYVRRMVSPIYYDEEGRNLAANVELYCDYAEINTAVLHRVLTSLIGYSLLGFFLFMLILQASKQIIKEVESLRRKEVLPNDQFVISEFRDLSQELSSYSRLKEHALAQEISSRVASQVSHDIRSPLAALEMISGSLGELPEDKRLIIRNSINRIRDIANSLLNKNASIESDLSTQNEVVQTESFSNTLLGPLVDSIITEKRIQYRNQIGVQIDFNQSKDSYGLFAKIQPIEFQRVLSNLINNAVEAFKDNQGSVELIMGTNHKNQIELTIKDNGKGIPADILSKLGKRGETYGKENGSGLGIFHAMETIKSFQGSLEIDSKLGNGTKVSIFLPRENEPAWFVPAIKLKTNQTLIVFDDDQSIHQIWKGRLESVPNGSQIQVRNFSDPTELRKFYGKNFTDLDEALFLMDYEISGSSENGLDLIENLGIHKQSILVTSRYEEKNIRDRCEGLGVKLIPKSMSGFVPIEVVI